MAHSLKQTIAGIENLATKQIVIEGYDLGRISGFLAFIGNPQQKYPVIHIGGTAGKGSTTAIISKILEGQGFKTGAYYSPHVIDPTERIQLNGINTSAADFVAEAEFIMQQMLQYFPLKAELKLTYFEFLLAMALDYFGRKQIDVLVLEVGIGGRLDPTNVVASLISIITSVGLDHTKLLGKTVEKIVSDKVQILKPDTIMLTAAKKPSVLAIMQDFAASQNSILEVLGSQFSIRRIAKSWDGYVFNYSDQETDYKNLSLKLLGSHQLRNAGLAIRAGILFMRHNGKTLDIVKLKASLMSVEIPGRIEVISRKPLIIMDSAHNGMKMSALVTTILELKQPGQKLKLLLAFKKGQQHKRLLRPLHRLRRDLVKMVISRFRVKQDMEQESEQFQNFYHYLKQILPETEFEFKSDPGSAYELLKKSLKPDEVLIITGSFYLLTALFKTGVLTSVKKADYNPHN
jgi:dihydrofolate synthase/folylpolyglutamate synthase